MPFMSSRPPQDFLLLGQHRVPRVGVALVGGAQQQVHRRILHLQLALWVIVKGWGWRRLAPAGLRRQHSNAAKVATFPQGSQQEGRAQEAETIMQRPTMLCGTLTWPTIWRWAAAGERQGGGAAAHTHTHTRAQEGAPPGGRAAQRMLMLGALARPAAPKAGTALLPGAAAVLTAAAAAQQQKRNQDGALRSPIWRYCRSTSVT